MKVVIDLDLHSAIQDFANRAPAAAYQFKSQDTVEWELYFVQNGVVIDMGSSFALKFGMIKAGDTAIPPTLLAYQTAFTYSTDSGGNIYYSGLVNFNTSQMATAIGTLPQINGTAEIRYQDALNEIIHSINISTVVYATIIVETGVTPPNVSAGYPDASTIELLVHKDAPSGYAGLNGSSQLFGAQIPVDNVTIQILDGQIASSSILAETAASFVTPAANATVNVTLVSSTGLVIGQYVRLPVAGYYIVQSIPDSTHAVLKNNGDPFNVASGVTVPADTPLLPAQAAAGGGAVGQNAYTTLQAGFTVPTGGATVSITVGSTAWMGGSGYAVFINGAGYYLINSITDATHVVVTNSGSAANQPPGTTVSTGGTVTGAGPQGASGATGASLSAYTTTTATFTMPSVGAPVTIIVGNTGWVSQNQIIFVAGAGYFQVVTVANATTLSCNNLNYPGNSTAGTVISSGANVTPAGLQGPQGAGGAGLNAFTTLSANFTQPAVGTNVTINVGSTTWMAVGQQIFIQVGGYYTLSSISDVTHVVVTNLGGPSNISVGSIVTGSGTQNVTPAGTPGTGGNAYTTTTASFTQPALGGSVTVSMVSTAWLAQNQYVFVAGGGTYNVSSITDATHAVLISVAAVGTVSSGTTVPSSSVVSASGSPGPQGATGATGPSGGIGEAPTDGQIYGRQNSAWAVVTGGGGGPILPSARAFDFDDFDSAIIANNQPNGKLGWLCKSAGSGSITSGSNQGANATDKANGVWSFGGAVTGDWESISLGDYTATSGAKPTIVPALGILTLEFRVGIVALPTGTQDLLISFGLCNNSAAITTNVPGDGIFFEYWFGNAITNWQFSTIAGGVATNTTTGTAAVAGGFHKFQILTNSGWTSIQALIDGVIKATNTAHIPTNNLCPFMRAGNLSASSWTSNVYIDYFFKDYQYTR